VSVSAPSQAQILVDTHTVRNDRFISSAIPLCVPTQSHSGIDQLQQSLVNPRTSSALTPSKELIEERHKRILNLINYLRVRTHRLDHR